MTTKRILFLWFSSFGMPGWSNFALAVLVFSAWSGIHAQGPHGLSSMGRVELVALKESGDSTVSMVFACSRAQTGRLAALVSSQGGMIRYRDDTVDYLRARIPIGAVDAVLASDAIDKADIDFNWLTGLAYLSEDKNISTAITERQDYLKVPTGSSAVDDAPLRNHYSPTTDLNADRFLARHPEFDGRGATIAYTDFEGFDMLLPEFQVATSPDGKPIPKVVEYRTATDPLEVPSYWWVSMRDAIAARDSTAADYQGQKYRLPRPGTFRIGIFQEPAPGELLGSGWQWDVTRSGKTNERFALLWDESTNQVWVDTDRCGDFTKHNAITDYRIRHDIGTFGHNDPRSPIRKTIGFTVQTDSRDKFIAINLGIEDHAGESLGGAAANGGKLGRYIGIAPGARYAMYGCGGVLHGAIEALIAAAKNPDVDVIVYEIFSYTDSSYFLKDGRLVQSIIADRIVERLHKPIVETGGNGPGLDQVSDEGVGSHVMSIGGYQSKESYLQNFGLVVKEVDNLHWGGLSHGPSGDGALKPDVLSPSGYLGSETGFNYPEPSHDGFAQFPPGYTIGGGTSQATPLAGGAYALLISAAKQSHIPYDAERLNYAVRNTARHLANYPAYQQGNGVIDIEKAWALLQAVAKQPPMTFRVQAPVKTVNSVRLLQPNIGRGIFEREGWFAGSSGDRTILITRTSGAARPMNFGCTWVSNDGTFSSPSTIALPLNSAVPFPVHIGTSTTGVHSAMLACSASNPGDSLRVLNSVVAAENPDSAPEQQVSRTILVRRPGDGSVYVYVPKGSEELHVTAHSLGNAISFRPIGPDGHCDCDNRRHHFDGVDVDFSLAYPAPGVWELVVSNNMDPRNKYDATLPAPLPDTAVEVKAQLGHARRQAPPKEQVAGQVTGGKQKVLSFSIGKNVSNAVITLNAADGGLNLYAIDCSRARCRGSWSIAVQSGPDQSIKQLDLPNPRPGRWVLVVDAANEAADRNITFALKYNEETAVAGANGAPKRP